MFLGVGHAGVNALALDGEDMAGVLDAVAYIERLRQAADKGSLEIGRRVVVIGGGNTAIDIAVQAKQLGAEDVTIVYRRGPDNMSATWHEQELAQTNGVRIKHWARPVRLIGHKGQLKEVEFEYTQLDEQGPADDHGRPLHPAGRHAVQGDRPELRARSARQGRQAGDRAQRRAHRR